MRSRPDPSDPDSLDLRIAWSHGRSQTWVTEDGDVDEGDLGAINRLPDLSDPATLGCLLALVREAWGVPELNPYWSDVRCEWVLWHVDDAEDAPRITAGSETEALVAALFAAPAPA